MQISRFTLRHGKSSNIPRLHANELGYVTDIGKLLIGTENGNKQLNTRVKGSAESEYRSGDVEITKVNIGLGNVDNTKDSEKSVKSAKSADSASKWTNARKITITSGSGDSKVVCGYVSIDGSKDIEINLEELAASILTGTASIDISGKAADASKADSAGKCTGNSATATKLQTPRTIKISIDGNTASKTFDGSGDITLELTNTNITSAKKLNSGSADISAGGSDTPVYFVNGLPSAVKSIAKALLSGEYDISITGNAKSANSADAATKAEYVTTSAAIGNTINPVYIAYDSTNKRGKVTACNVAKSGAFKSFVPTVGSDGVMEVGKCIDFHDATSTADYDVRLTSTSGALECSGTFTATKVYNAVWNDYADALLRDDRDERIEPGHIVSKSYITNGYKLASKKSRDMIVGVCSDTYGHLLGGERLENMEDNLEKYVPVAVAGNVMVMVTGNINAGDLITISNKRGIGKKANRFFHRPGTIVGKALESKYCKDDKRILMQVMLM